MRDNVEKRLHRVKIAFDRKNVKCPQSNNCQDAENCDRCNIYYEKCNIYVNDS